MGAIGDGFRREGVREEGFGRVGASREGFRKGVGSGREAFRRRCERFGLRGPNQKESPP